MIHRFSRFKSSLLYRILKFLNYRRKHDTPSPSLNLEGFNDFTFSKRSHWQLFAGYDQELYYQTIEKDNCTLKKYQDLLVFKFIKDHITEGGRILDVGGGLSRILHYFSKTHECWNVDKMEGLGNGPTMVAKVPYKLVNDYMGNFNPDLPANFFDLVFSISALEHTPEDETVFSNIISDIDRVLKPGGFSLHLLDVRFLPNGRFWTNPIVHTIFKKVETLNKYTNPEQAAKDPDLYVMSKKAYDKKWLPITKMSYEQFGRPASLNILWRKPV